MDKEGFSIRCPHCFEWSEWEYHPREYSINTEEEWQEILRNFQADPEGFSHPRMLECKQPVGKCPAPFQAFVCDGPETAHLCVQKISTWTLRRAFQLRKKDQVDRWPQYSAFIFCTRRVPRQKHIELEQLLDRDLLNRAIVGMSVEINAPITVYAAKVFEVAGDEPEYRKYWIPVEAYEEERQVPPRFNMFCYICRKAIIENVLCQFEGKVNTKNCPLHYKDVCTRWGMIKAPCEIDDWNHCPVFLDARREFKMCYEYDTKLCNMVENKWRSGDLIDPGYYKHCCWVGFEEIAAPIEVHEHLIAVTITGQFVIDESKLLPIKDIMNKYPLLQSYQKQLERSRKLLLEEKTKAINDKERHTKRFRIKRDEFINKAKRIVDNSKRISTVARAQYNQFRYRSEATFRKEMLNRIEELPTEQHFTKNEIFLEIIERMCEFWAFRAVYFLQCHLSDRYMSVLAYCKKDQRPRLCHQVMGVMSKDLGQTQPLPWLYDHEMKNIAVDPWAKEFTKFFKIALADKALNVPKGRYYFFVAVPLVDDIYVFAFTVRDEDEVSPLRPREKGGISELCQDVILNTCTEIMNLCELRYHGIKEQQIKLEAWRAMAAKCAHSIGNQIFVARGTLRGLRKHGVQFDDLEYMQKSIHNIGNMCNQFKKFRIDKLPELQQADIKTILDEEISRYREIAEGASIISEIPETLPQCRWDINQLREVVEELLMNALNHTPSNGEIIVSADLFEQKGLSFVRIVVYNTGSGIKAEWKQKIFDAFSSTYLKGGTGLGLAIVFRIIKNHRGKIYEDGQPGKYARFVIELPVDPQKEL